MALDILSDPFGAKWPEDCVWEQQSKSLIHISYYYRRNKEEILNMKQSEAKRLGLWDLFEQQLVNFEDKYATLSK